MMSRASSSSRCADRRQARRHDAGRRLHLVGEVELLEDQRPLADAQAAEVLAVSHHELADPGEPGVGHRADEQRVGLLGAVLRPDEVRVGEEHRVDLVVGHEVLQVDRVLPFDLDGLEVLVGQVDELALRVLERLDDLVVRDRLVLELADLLVADRPVVLLVHEVKLQLVLVHGAEDPHRQVDEPERDRAGPERDEPPSAQQPSPNRATGNGAFVREADAGSSARPMAPPDRGRSVALHETPPDLLPARHRPAPARPRRLGRPGPALRARPAAGGCRSRPSRPADARALGDPTRLPFCS